MTTQLIQAIQGLEEQTWRAMCNSGRDLLPYLSNDCIMLFPLGLKVSMNSEPNLEDVMTSEAFVPWKSYKMSNVEVIPLGQSAALISYTADAMRPPIERSGGDQPFKALISSTWREDPQSGRWLLCFHQQTPFEDLGL